MRNSQLTHPRNPWIRNGRLADLYLWSVHKRIRFIKSALGALLNTEIACELPERLFLPHPYGIIVGPFSELGNDVTLMQQVTLGGRDPWCDKKNLRNEYPKLRDGVYVGAGAKILGGITVGEWAIIGANAVVTKDVRAGATVVGYNHIIGAG
jgi:serine O-acetyltransferase